MSSCDIPTLDLSDATGCWICEREEKRWILRCEEKEKKRKELKRIMKKDISAQFWQNLSETSTRVFLAISAVKREKRREK
jgi:hypothetical protein